MDRRTIWRAAVRPAGQHAPTATRRTFLSAAAALAAAPSLGLALPAAAGEVAAGGISVRSGQRRVLTRTTRVGVLTLAPDGTLVPPSGHSLTMTVDGVETGQVLTTTRGTGTAIAPGTYRGEIVLTVAAANPVVLRTPEALTFPLRQALYVDATGLVTGKSVLASVLGGQLTSARASDVAITSTGQAFNGVYVDDAAFTLEDPRIELTGNGRCDFVGYGAAIVGTGPRTALVVDGAVITTRGAVRTAVVADDGANVIVKNSTIRVRDGVLPADYRPTVDCRYMESAPWMLGISGNVRATNLLGTGSRATYINSALSSQGWGVLSTDHGRDGTLTAVTCELANTGEDGYGCYACPDYTLRFLGTRFEVGTYACINRGGAVHCGDSTRQAVAQLNTDLALGLRDQELDAIPERPTVINSRRFGFMWQGAGTVDITGGTVVNSRETAFLNKGQQAALTVDGSRGARISPGNGIILQVMDSDDTGPVAVDGQQLNEGVYHEPTGGPAKVHGFDVTAVHSTDATAAFTGIALTGHFYNAIRTGSSGDQGLNLVLTLDNSSVQGVISASRCHHAISTITADQYRRLGEVTNTVQAVVNNGVILHLANGSRWTVTGTSYQSRLVLAPDAAITAPPGRTVSMAVDGVATAVEPGSTYSGAIVLTVD